MPGSPVVLHVNGPATLYWNAQLLGWSSEGATLNFNGKFHDVFTDRMGWMEPENVLIMGEDATVNVELIAFASDILSQITSRVNNSNTLSNGYIGSLMLRTNRDQPQGCWKNRTGILTIAKNKRSDQCSKMTEEEGGFEFYEAYLMDSYTRKVSTRVTKINLIFRCLPLMTTLDWAGNNIPAGTLYQRLAWSVDPVTT